MEYIAGVQLSFTLFGVPELTVCFEIRSVTDPAVKKRVYHSRRKLIVDTRTTDIWEWVAARVAAQALSKPNRFELIGQRARQPSIRAGKELTPMELKEKAALDDPSYVHPQMPKSDEECRAIGLGSTIPCPFVRCRHHLGIEVLKTGGLRVICPHWEDDFKDPNPPTCSLVESDDNPHDPTTTGQLLGIGPDLVGKIERDALATMAARMGMTADRLEKAMRLAATGADSDSY